MSSGRRLAALLVALALVALPAVALRAFCVGRTCDRTGEVTARVPFCPLPEEIRNEVAAGFYAGRSPDVLGVASGGIRSGRVAWPSTGILVDPSVPVAFFGAGVDPSAELPDGMALDRIAPTLEEVLGFDRPHPEVRTGFAVGGLASGQAHKLVVEIVWTGVGPAELADEQSWPSTFGIVGDGPFTMKGNAGSLPLDPVAILTTIGTGGLPSKHGMTGELVRNDSGEVVPPWGPGSPPSVIATLPDDLDEALQQSPRVALIAPDISSRGLIGGTWYFPHDRDDVLVDPPGDPASGVTGLLRHGYGVDEVPDVIGVVLDGPIRRLDALTGRIIEEVGARRPDTTFVFTTTGSAAPLGSIQAERVIGDLDPASGSVVEAAVPGGLFLDQGALAQGGLTSGDVVDAMLSLEPDGGGKLFADAFPGFAVSFARYC